jgi:uncharacterized protein
VNQIEADTPRPPAAQAETFAPVLAGERVQTIDILRGIAILGVLVVNMQFFFAPMSEMFSGTDRWPGAVDGAAEALIRFLAQGKFYTMFSFLFGLGMAIQMERAEARGGSFVPFFARRLSWLLLIGAAHAFLLWFGDILATYALVGFPLILFRKRKNLTLLVWTIALAPIPLLLMALFVGAVQLALHSPAAADVEQDLLEMRQRSSAMTETAREVYANGSYSEMLPVRAREVGLIYQYSFMAVPGILAMFLIGLNLGRRRFFHRVPEQLPAIRRWFGILVLIGLPANAVLTATMGSIDQVVPSPALLLQQIAFTFGGPALCFAYVLGILLLLQDERWRQRLTPLAAVGRMALTNYLTHSILFTTIANGYGLGLYGRVGPAAGLVMALALYAVQVVLSNWWLRRFRFGPMEWLWRSLSYLRPQPLAR